METQKNLQNELEIAKNIAIKTWEMIVPYYDAGVVPEIKQDGSPVTIADKIANKFILESLSDSFPNDSIVSEEDKNITRGGRTWYIDPIDGTKGFIKRNGHCAIHIGLCENEKPVLGVVYWAPAGDMYSGIVGVGAYRENSRGNLELDVSPQGRQKLIASVNGDIIPKDLRKFYEDLGVEQYHNTGSEGLRLMKLAENRADLRICESQGGTNTWDLCAPHAIFSAAGGILKYLDGGEILYRGQARFGTSYFAVNSCELEEKIVRNLK